LAWPGVVAVPLAGRRQVLPPMPESARRNLSSTRFHAQRAVAFENIEHYNARIADSMSIRHQCWSRRTAGR
jgi:hypothetical protein